MKRPRYFLSADLEGVSGVTHPLQCYPKQDRTGFGLAVENLANEINAVAKAIFSIHPDADVVVNDAHSTMVNLSLNQLDSRLTLISGKPKKCAMMSGLDASFDGVFLVGYHAKAGTESGVLNHTFHQSLFDVRINGVSYGEAGLNALYAALVFDVPTLLAAGDQVFCREIKALVQFIHTVETKIGLSTTAAQCHPLNTVLQSFTDKTREALQSKFDLNAFKSRFSAPYQLEITFIDTLSCDIAALSPFYTRINGTTLATEKLDDFETVYRALQAAYTSLAFAATLG